MFTLVPTKNHMNPVQTSYPISVINLKLSSSPNVGRPSGYYR